MSARKRQAPDSMEQGESKVSLPRPGRGRVGVVSVGPRAVAGGGRSSPTAPGQGPSFPQQAGPRLGTGHLLGRPCLQCPLPLQGLQPCPSASWAGTEQALGGNPSGTRPPAPQRCSFPLPFALSPPACMLCRRAEADPDTCGHKLEKQGICAHEFCLVSSSGAPQLQLSDRQGLPHSPHHLLVFSLLQFFANKLFQQGSRDGVRLKDIRRTIARAAQKELSPDPEKELPALPTSSGTEVLLPAAPQRLQHRRLDRQADLRAVTQQRPRPAPCPEHCFVCGESGATITCWETGCDRSFHLPCAVEGGCITQFFGLYRSFCWEHRPEQAVEAAPEENTTCLICLELVGDRKSYSTMVCPACKHAWFHRGCIQNQAMHAGYSCFCCPHCQNEYRFLMEMLTMGIRIPRRLKSGGCKRCAMPGPALAVLALRCPVPLGFRFTEELETGQGGKSKDALRPPYAGAAGAHQVSFLHQTAIMGEQPRICRTKRQGACRGRGVSCQSCTPGLRTGSLSRQGLEAEGLRARALPDNPVLRSLCPHSHEPVCFPRPWQLLLCCSCAAEGTHRRCSYSRNSTASWECDGCAGLGTGKRQSIQVPLGSGCPGRAWQSLSAPGGLGPPLWPILPQGLGGRALDPPASVTASSASSELAGPSTASQSGSGPSRGSPAPETTSPSPSSHAASGQSLASPAPETSSPSSGSQAASGLSHSSPAPETSSPSAASQSGSGPSHGSPTPKTSSPSTGSQAALGPSRGSPVLEGSSCSSPSGPDRMRNRSRLNRRAQTPYSRPSRRRDSSHAPAPSAESSTPSQAALGLSHGCPVPETSSPSTASQLPSGSSYGSPALQGSLCSSPPGPERVRDRSRLQRRAQTPYSRPSRRRESSRAPAPSAESSTPSQAALGPSHGSPVPETSSLSTASQLPSGSSCGSPALKSGRRSSSPGPVRMRDRSRLQRRAQTPYSRPGGRRGTSRAPSPSAGPDPPPPAQ
ncbi:hypothetical protein QYF61_015576 [Mycteria americana]|uniref:PHD finger protein 7 n=1 Tax=Mycteria americana TaxID=33587 RepID=A0AAN7NQ59_MYCAM|nr:hypothetical protein QYF61_015576 [Mycteria americana]